MVEVYGFSLPDTALHDGDLSEQASRFLNFDQAKSFTAGHTVPPELGPDVQTLYSYGSAWHTRAPRQYDSDTASRTDSSSEFWETSSHTSSNTSGSESDSSEDASQDNQTRCDTHGMPFPENRHAETHKFGAQRDDLTGLLQETSKRSISRDSAQRLSNELDSQKTGPANNFVTKHGTRAQPISQHQVQAPPQAISTDKCSRRRTGSFGSNGQLPPRLKRDTESSDCFVMYLIAFTCRLITAIWPLSAVPPMMTTCFGGAGVLPLETFVYETLRRSKTSYSTLQVALFYLVMLKNNLPKCDFTKEQPSSQNASSCRATQCGRRMFLSALMLASKYLQDRNYSTRAWSKISGLRIPEINENEMEYLKRINYNLHMTKDMFDNWSKLVLTFTKISKMQPRCLSYTEGTRSLSPGSDTLNDMLASNFSDASHTMSQSFSRKWWGTVLTELDPDVVRSSSRTDEFLDKHVPADQVDRSMPAPTLPYHATSGSPDLSFGDAFGSQGPQSNVSTPVQMAAASPAQTAKLAFRPQPRKLQTPQSTPRGSDRHSWAGQPQQPQKPLRSAISASALGCIAKVPYSNAGRLACPPPQLHKPPTPPYINDMAKSALQYQPFLHSSSGPSPPPTPEESTASQAPRMARTGYRSRSNSISSISSASSSAPSLPDQFRAGCFAPGTLSLRAAHTKLPPRITLLRSGGQNTLKRMPGRIMREKKSFTNSEDAESMSSGCSALASDAELAAADALMGMHFNIPQTVMQQHRSESQESTPKASRPSSLTGHKRTKSKIDETLHDNVQLRLRADSGFEEVAEDSKPSITAKQLQLPTKGWAQPKQPIYNTISSKRFAHDCGSQQRQSYAPDLTRAYLRPDLVG